MDLKDLEKTASSIRSGFQYFTWPICAAVLGSFLLAGGFLMACSSQGETPKSSAPPVPVITSEAKVQDVPLYFESIGTLKPVVWVAVRPQANGMLQEVHFTDGQQVKKGDPLFTIDSSGYAISLQEAEAQLAQNLAALDSARRKMERFRNLSKKDLIPQQEWDEMQAQVAKGEAQVLGDQAKVASAKLNLDRCVIRSPIDGRTGQVVVHPGNLVADSQPSPLVTLSNINDLVVDFTLTEREFQQLTPEHRQGTYPIEIRPFNASTQPGKGTLTFLDSTFDAETGLLHLQGKMSNDQLSYLPGQHVRVRIPVLVKHGLLVIPQKAIKINQAGPYVFIVNGDNAVDMRQVKLADEIDSNVVVLEGLAAGDKVVTEGHLRLAPGLKVEIRKNE